MESRFSTDRIIELLVKVNINELEPAERQELDAWLEADPANRALYSRLSDEDYLRRQYAIYKRTGYPDGWEELKLRREISLKRRSAGRRITRWGGAVAAVASLFFGLIWYIGHDKGDNTGKGHEAVMNIVPGMNDAVIELASGEKIILDENNAGNIEMLADGLSISGDSMLRYDAATRESGSKINEKHTFRVPRGATTKVLVLSDGTRVWLNAGSTITYPVMFAAGERSVEITGECYFDVNEEPSRPFMVKTQDVSIRVTGTQFNVMSYADDSDVETTLVSGRVSISASNKEVSLAPGVQAIYNKESSDISLRDVDTRIVTAWKEGVFEFNNMTIENICHVLGRWYDIEFEFEDHRVRSLPFNGTLKRDRTLAFILDRISETNTIDYKMENGKVVVMRK